MAHDNRKTFRQVYDAHARFVWRVLLRLGVPERDLPDGVQDVFVVVHRKLGEFDPRAKMTTWLFSICRRVASDRRQAAHARRELPHGEPPDAPRIAGEAPPDAGALLDRQRARALLDAIVQRMPEEQRVVFGLFELDGMSGEEIAELLEVPVGTVRSRLRLARTTFNLSVARWRARERDGLPLPPVPMRPREA